MRLCRLLLSAVTSAESGSVGRSSPNVSNPLPWKSEPAYQEKNVIEFKHETFPRDLNLFHLLVLKWFSLRNSGCYNGPSNTENRNNQHFTSEK